MRVLIGHDPAVSAYIADATGDPLHAPFRTIGIYSGQQMIGGWALDEYTGYGVNLSGAGRGTMLREARQVLCDVVYGFLGCRRIGIVVRKTNKRMQRMAIRLGFTFEGKLRRYYGTEDGIVYSLLSDEAVALGHWQPLAVNRSSEPSHRSRPERTSPSTPTAERSVEALDPSSEAHGWH